MNASDFIKTCEVKLSELYSKEESRSLAFRLIEEFAGIDLKTYALNPKQELRSEVYNKVYDSLEELSKNRPIQYIIGFEWFLGRKFIVNENVLIPRPETEELVLWASDFIKEKRFSDKITVLDAACGSGIIGISLACMVENATIWACDKSADALEISTINSAIIPNVNIYNTLECDLLNDKESSSNFNDASFNMVISNPPYVKNSEKRFMRANVLDFEPHIALFVSDNDPLIFYRKIAKMAMRVLKNGGVLFFEINESESERTIECVKNEGFKLVETKEDFRGKIRFLRAIKR